MKRLVPLLALAGALACTSGAPTGHAVVAGSLIQVQQAPWAVFIRQVSANGIGLCGGSIVDTFHVLTAAHCVYDQRGNLAGVATLTVRAGISNFSSPLPTDVEQ